MPKSWMIADFLRPYAQWRIERAEERDDGRNARAAIGLIDAAAYAMQMDDSDRLIARMASAGCFAHERFNPGTEGERLIRRWHYDDTEGAPRDLFFALADAVERGVGPSPAPPASRAASRWSHLDRGARPQAPQPGAPADDRTAHTPDGAPPGRPGSPNPSPVRPVDGRDAGEETSTPRPRLTDAPDTCPGYGADEAGAPSGRRADGAGARSVYGAGEAGWASGR
ncbi:hypothetical protein [Actinomadura harenae]|uniref:Uncharacterized protein n=1 Tax=Actinomadura harenae TaxID=2483351 RepID=A0A3M2MA30_9ACTN|nr:hypothetical protein [Actinomadura harenae]RMI46332.1 hypothetical protein EBO15_07135 [Actinomadura harenae]